MDEVAIWSKALTSNEVSDLYNSGNGLPYDEEISDPIDIDTLSAQNIGDDTAKLRGEVTTFGDYTYANVYFQYRFKEAPDPEEEGGGREEWGVFGGGIGTFEF